ncbi:sortilin-related receptor-like isoform X1 [Argopecten irradians]|uniref:sortilin-related receptor-like isoform X1 n=1 Tax=Argopecten irradians TaxID=31199 RepID=UPI00371364DB
MMCIYSIAMVVLLIKSSHQQNIVPERRREQAIAIQTNEILEQVLPLIHRYLENEISSNSVQYGDVKTTLGVLQTELQATKTELNEIKTQLETTKQGVTESSMTKEDRSQHNQFQCRKSDLRIPNGWLCDGDNDCGDNSDEENCNHDRSSECLQHTNFLCKDKRMCLPIEWLCDGDSDCTDNSDEENCNHG